LPLSTTVRTFHFHSSGGKAAPQCPIRLPPTTNLSRRPTPPGKRFPCHRLPPLELIIDHRRPCTSDPATTSRRTTRARSSSTSTPSPSATFRPHHRRSPSPAPSQAYSGEPPFHPRLPIGPSWTRCPPRQHLPHCLVTGRRDFTGTAQREEGDWGSPASAHGPKGQVGRETLAGLA
jgi:hypothetical protein